VAQSTDPAIKNGFTAVLLTTIRVVPGATPVLTKAGIIAPVLMKKLLLPEMVTQRRRFLG